MTKSQAKQYNTKQYETQQRKMSYLIPSSIACSSAPSAVVIAAAKSASLSESEAFIVANH